jgi:hypothetical protein
MLAHITPTQLVYYWLGNKEDIWEGNLQFRGMWTNAFGLSSYEINPREMVSYV